MSTLQGIASSPKVNRYLPWVAGAVLLAGLIAFLIAHYSNTVKANPDDKLSNKPAQVEQSLGKAISLPPAARSVAARFIDAGVRGENATVAWQLSGPEIRQGESLAQWKRDWNNPNVGVPITPYPASQNAQLLIDYARQKEIQLKFALLPVKGSHQKAQMFLMVLNRIGGRWVVNSWQSYSPPAIPAPYSGFSTAAPTPKLGHMGSMLASPRRRRRLAWLAALAAVALAALLALVFMRNTAPLHKETFTKDRLNVYVTPKSVPHTRAERVSALTVAGEFLTSALRRTNVDLSWRLTERSLHTGFTRAQWDTGNSLPFPPYNFRQVRWRRDYSYPNQIGLQVAVFPAKGEHQKAMVFYLDMKRHGVGKHEHWLVSDFVPAPSSGTTPPGIAEGAGGGVTGLHLSVPGAGTAKSPLSAYWLLLPLSALSLIVLLPLGLGIRGVVRNRRASRQYARELRF